MNAIGCAMFAVAGALLAHELWLTGIDLWFFGVPIEFCGRDEPPV